MRASMVINPSSSPHGYIYDPAGCQLMWDAHGISKRMVTDSPLSKSDWETLMLRHTALAIVTILPHIINSSSITPSSTQTGETLLGSFLPLVTAFPSLWGLPLPVATAFPPPCWIGIFAIQKLPNIPAPIQQQYYFTPCVPEQPQQLRYTNILKSIYFTLPFESDVPVNI